MSSTRFDTLNIIKTESESPQPFIKEEEETPPRKPCRLILHLPPRPKVEPLSPAAVKPPIKTRKSRSKPMRKTLTKALPNGVSERKLTLKLRCLHEPKLTLKLRCLRDPLPPKTPPNKYPYFLGGKSYNLVRYADQHENVSLGITPLIGKKDENLVPNGMRAGDEREASYGPYGELIYGSKKVDNRERFLRAQLWGEGRWARRKREEQEI